MGFRRALGNSADARRSRAQRTSRRLKSRACRPSRMSRRLWSRSRSFHLSWLQTRLGFFLSAARVESS